MGSPRKFLVYHHCVDFHSEKYIEQFFCVVLKYESISPSRVELKGYGNKAILHRPTMSTTLDLVGSRFFSEKLLDNLLGF